MGAPLAVDCRGLACPGPVLRVMDVLDTSAPGAQEVEALEVLVDDPAAQENVTRLLVGKGFAVSAAVAPDCVTLSARREGGAPPAAAPCPVAQPGVREAETITVFITADGMGRGSDELGGKLMLNFVATLPELGPGLWRVVLVNGGVRLACEGHPCLEKLAALAEGGVSVLVCGTCLGFFGLMDKKRVGETTNMLDVVTSLGLAGKVIQV